MLREPRTADVIEGVIDVEFNRNQGSSLSSTTTNNANNNFITSTSFNPTNTSTNATTSLMANMVKDKMAQNLIAAYGNLAASMSTPTSANNSAQGCLIAPVPCVASTSGLMPPTSDSMSTSSSIKNNNKTCQQQISAATLVSNMIDVMGTSSVANSNLSSCNTTISLSESIYNDNNSMNTSDTSNSTIPSFQFAQASNLSEL